MTIIDIYSIKQRAFADAQTHTTLANCPYLPETDAYDVYKKHFEIEHANIERENAIQKQSAMNIKTMLSESPAA